MWINTKVEFEWDGEQYVEVHSEGYEYGGDIDYAQVIPTMGDSYSPPGGGGRGGTSPQGSQGPWSDDPAFFEWFMGSYPNMDWDSLSEQQQYEYWKSYQQVTKETGGDDGTGDDGTGDDGTGDDVAGDGDGDDGIGAEDPTQDQVDKETQIDPNDPRQVGDQWMDSAGNLWASYEEAYASNVRIRQAEEERAGRVKDFEDRFAEYETLIEEGSAEEKALAQRMSARMRGQLQRRIEDSILATGGEVPEGFEERLAETSTRQLLDITSNIEQRRIAQLTGAKQFEIGTDMSLEQIGMQEQGLEQQMYQFLSTQAQRESQFERGLGMQQAELALQRELGMGQLGLGRDQLAEGRRQFNVEMGYQLTPEQQMKMAQAGAFGQLGGSIIGAFGGGIWNAAKSVWGRLKD
tara:strand:- start:5844 stop:7058 length:1215 start_codon:yes stop_codon:yes gene_type:complete